MFITVQEVSSLDLTPAGSDDCPIRLQFNGMPSTTLCDSDISGRELEVFGSLEIQLSKNRYDV